MNQYVTGAVIKRLREEKNMTQLNARVIATRVYHAKYKVF